MNDRWVTILIVSLLTLAAITPALIVVGLICFPGLVLYSLVVALICLPFGFGLGILWCEGQRQHQATLFQTQVDYLERLWQRSIQS